MSLLITNLNFSQQLPFCSCGDWEPCACGNQPPVHCMYCCLDLSYEQIDQWNWDEWDYIRDDGG